MKLSLYFVIAKTLLVCCKAQFIVNGDTTQFTQMKKANVMEEIDRLKALEAELKARREAEVDTQEMLITEEKEAYIARGSFTFPDGSIIEENIGIDEQPIDPRTPKSFGNPFIRQLEALSATLSVAQEEEAKDFWYTTIPIMIGGNMYTLPVGEEQFTARLRRWYQALFNLNMGEIIDDFGHGHYQPYCNQTSMESYKQLYEPQCRAPCQCEWYSSAAWRTRCEMSCADGDLIGLFECRWANTAKDSIVPLAKANNYAKHQTACGLQIDLAYSKQLMQAQEKVVQTTEEHPMEMDISLSMGTF